MSIVEASERLVARPRDEKVANTATEDVIVVEGLRVAPDARATTLKLEPRC